MKVDLQGEPVVTVLSRYLGAKIPFGIVPNLPSIPDPAEATRFLPGGFLGKLAGWTAGSDPSLEKLVLKARLTPGAARIALWQDVQRQMNQDGPWMPLVNPTQVIATTKDVSGVVFNPIWTVDFRYAKPA